MMNSEQVQALLEAGIDGAQVRVQGGDGRFDIGVVAPVFEGLNRVRRQQLVYGSINAHIADGSIHAVNIVTYTPEEWDKAQRMGLA